MKFNARTIQILRNFSSIHQALLFKPGKTLKVMSDTRSVLAKATIETDIEGTFAIYDVPKFLNAISMFDEPVLTHNNTYVEIRQGNEKINYLYAEPSLIRTPPEKDITLPTVDVQFELKNETINRVLKGMAIVGADALCITGEDGKIYLEGMSLKATKGQGVNGTTYRAEVGVTDKKFNFVFSADNVKLLAGDYDVSISQKGFAHFKGSDIEYWIAVEATSTYDG
mgnify:CR=1 FL=1